MEKIKLKSGEIRFREMLWISGKPIKSPLFARKTDCNQWLADQKSKKLETILYGEYENLRKNISFKEYSIFWFKSKEANGLAKSTLSGYLSIINTHLLPILGEKNLKDIKRHEIEKLQLDLAKRHNPKGTNIIMTVLKSILKGALEDEYIIKNPAQFIKKTSEDNHSDVYWTKAEIDQFLRANFNHPLYELFLIAINTGMRKGELGGLCWDRVNFQTNQITITRTRDKDELKERTKTKLKRYIPMNPIIRATLLSLFQKRCQSPFVFIKPDGNSIDVHHIYRDFKKCQVKAGMTQLIRFHDLRHTFASQFVMNGENIFDLQKILGHTNINMTMRYAHFSAEHLQKAMNRFTLGESIKIGENNMEVNQYLTNEKIFEEKVVCL